MTLSSTPERLCIILHQLGWGGVDRVAAILANGFAERGVETDLLVCAEGGEGEDELKQIIGDNVTIHFFRQSSGSIVVDLLSSFTKFGNQLKEIKPDVVLSAGNQVSMFSMLLKTLYCPQKTRLFIKTTNPILRPSENVLKRMMRRLWYKLIFRQCNGVLPLTDAESRFIQHSFPEYSNRILTVSNPYITKDHASKSEESNAPSTTKGNLIVAVGSMTYRKRFDLLLHAFAIVRKKIDCKLVILGDGEEREALSKLTSALELTQSVEMPGFVTNTHEWLAKSDLFVLSSEYEGLPAVVLEALAHNCPVVTTNCFLGAEDLLEGASRCGVTPRGDPDALAEGIMNSLGLDESTSNLSQLTKPYTVEAAIDSHLKAINFLLS